MKFNRIPGNLQKRPTSTFLRINLKVYGWIEYVEKKVASIFQDRVTPDGEIVPGLFKRLGAFLLDSIFIVLALFFGEWLAAKFLQGESLMAFYIYMLILLFPSYFILTGLIWASSPGKMALGFGIKNNRNAKLGKLQIVLRELVKYTFLAFGPVIMVIALFSKRFRTLADFVSSTRIAYR